MFNDQPAILLTITKSADANVIETVDRIRELLPEIKRWIPPGIDISVLSDRTGTLRASVHDMQLTLGLSVVLVMLVVYVFLRRPTPTIAAGITVPLSLAGTCAAMWCAGFSINNLTLMALAVSVGFVVDDAIVMIENMFRNLEAGHAADAGRARRRAPDRLHGHLDQRVADRRLHPAAVHGRRGRPPAARVLRHAGVRHRVSTVVSLTVTPMICAHFVRAGAEPRRHPPRPHRRGRHGLDGCAATCARSRPSLRHRLLMTFVMLATIAVTVNLYIKTPKGYFPQDDTGLVFGSHPGLARHLLRGHG